MRLSAFDLWSLAGPLGLGGGGVLGVQSERTIRVPIKGSIRVL